MFCISLLKCLLFRAILFPNSVNIFITNVLNSSSGKLFFSVSLFSLALLIESSSFAFSFCLTFSASVNLDETVKLVLLWEHYYTDSVCPVPLVRELDLTWMKVTSFLKVCWLLSPW